MFEKTKKIPLSCLGEVFGTGIIGGLLAYPVATMVMGKQAALFAYVMPFLTATAVGSLLAFMLISSMKKSGAFRQILKIME